MELVPSNHACSFDVFMGDDNACKAARHKTAFCLEPPGIYETGNDLKTAFNLDGVIYYLFSNSGVFTGKSRTETLPY